MPSNDSPTLDKSRSSAPRPPRWSSRTGPVARLAPALATAAAAFLLLYGIQMAPGVPDPEPLDAGVPEVAGAYVEPTWAADAADMDWPDAIGKGMRVPDGPLKGQKTACDRAAGETNINGGCYLALEQKPPCLPRQFEHGGKCYAPVRLADPLPATIGQ